MVCELSTNKIIKRTREHSCKHFESVKKISCPFANRYDVYECLRVVHSYLRMPTSSIRMLANDKEMKKMMHVCEGGIKEYPAFTANVTSI